ncbi:MAG TPA: FG-GAP-like repeat-containing protein, partial [Polyangiaceae bacterium]
MEFRDPVSGGNGDDPASFSNQKLRILAASHSASDQKKDKLPGTLGAQYDVVVCTSAPAGSSAQLAQGWYGDTLNQVKSATVAADTNNLCGGSQPSVVVFTDVTLNESTVKADYTLNKATELRATITDLNFGVGTASINVWVDSISPSLTLVAPASLCGSYINNASGSTQALTFGTPVVPVTATITPDVGSATSYVSSAPLTIFSQVTIPNVLFPVGTSLLTATAMKPSGNGATFPSTGACSIKVGTTPPPTVTWTAVSPGSSPIAGSKLTATGNTTANSVPDSDAAAGWQGTLRACVSGTNQSGVTLQFSVNGIDIGSPQAVDSNDGCASLAVTNQIPEGGGVQLSARTSSTDNGVGVGTLSVAVDSARPSTPVNLAATVKSHRQTSFTLRWNLPADGSAATAYNVRVAKSKIDDATKFDAAEVVAFGGTPQPIGQTDSIDVLNRLIENTYYFAVQAVDSVGNVSDLAFTDAGTIEKFVQTEIPAPEPGTNFGWSADGTADINGDQYSDLVVGSSTGTNVYIYFGSANGYSVTPNVTIQGAAAQFGRVVAVVGDINKDTRNDIVIGSPKDGSGYVYVYYGRSSWPATLTSSNADVTIYGDSVADTKYSGQAQFGASIARIGDFNNDTVDDFAIGVPYYSQLTLRNVGQVIIVYGKAGGLGSSIVLPGAFGASATRIDGDTSAAGRLGFGLCGAAYFYGTSGGTSLIASAAYTPTAAGSNAGRLYAIKGVSGAPPASIAISAASNTFDSGLASGALGAYGTVPLGDLGPAGQPAFGVQYLTTTVS